MKGTEMNRHIGREFWLILLLMWPAIKAHRWKTVRYGLVDFALCVWELATGRG